MDIKNESFVRFVDKLKKTDQFVKMMELAPYEDLPQIQNQ